MTPLPRATVGERWRFDRPPRGELVERLVYVTFCLADGLSVSFDLDDPRTPLPSFRSLVVMEGSDAPAPCH